MRSRALTIELSIINLESLRNDFRKEIQDDYTT